MLERIESRRPTVVSATLWLSCPFLFLAGRAAHVMITIYHTTYLACITVFLAWQRAVDSGGILALRPARVQ